MCAHQPLDGFDGRKSDLNGTMHANLVASHRGNLDKRAEQRAAATDFNA